MMASTSVNKVLHDSSTGLILCVLISDESMVLTDLICLSHTPTTLLATSGFFFHMIQSALFSSKKPPLLLLPISFMHFSSSFSAPTKLLPLSHQIDLMEPGLAMKCQGARMNKSVSILLVIPM